jgi:hypothetical protein
VLQEIPKGVPVVNKEDASHLSFLQSSNYLMAFECIMHCLNIFDKAVGAIMSEKTKALICRAKRLSSLV